MIKNEHHYVQDLVLIYVNSEKYGNQTVLMDAADLKKIIGRRVYVWGTPRHNSLYAMVQVENGKSVRLHRIITDAPKNKVIDHINGDGLDNTRKNLRITTQANNNKNAVKRKNAKTSKYKGVSFNKREQKWKAQIQLNGKKYNLGTFSSEREAANAYNIGALELFGDYATVNDLAEAK